MDPLFVPLHSGRNHRKEHVSNERALLICMSGLAELFAANVFRRHFQQHGSPAEFLDLAFNERFILRVLVAELSGDPAPRAPTHCP